MIISISFILTIALLNSGNLELTDTKNILTTGDYISVALLQNFMPYLTIQLILCLLFTFKRYKDRGYKSNIYQSDEELDDIYDESNIQNDEVNSLTQKIQRNLNDLYTGHIFEVSFMQAHIITIVFVCLMFSGGMPLLYFVCTAYLMAIFFFSKVVILK